jgi:hypothetical protein
MGSAETFQVQLLQEARRIVVRIVLIEYRLEPEHD